MSKQEMFRVAVLAGDGIGPEVMAEALKVLIVEKCAASVATWCEGSCKASCGNFVPSGRFL